MEDKSENRGICIIPLRAWYPVTETIGVYIEKHGDETRY